MNAIPKMPAAKDLSKDYLRSPRETLAGYVIAARILDKCRAAIAGTLGEYHFDCRLDRFFLEFAGLSAGSFRAFVATGADDEQVSAWIARYATPHSRLEVVKWKTACAT